MAKWASLGIVEVSEVWQAFPLLAGDVTTFRLIHSTIIDPFNSCYLSQYFNLPMGVGRSRWQRLRASDTPQIIELPIPEDFRTAGISTRAIEVKWRLPYYPVRWQIELQAFEVS